MKIVFAVLYFFYFLNAVWALTSGGFRVVFDTLVLLQERMSFNNNETATLPAMLYGGVVIV